MSLDDKVRGVIKALAFEPEEPEHAQATKDTKKPKIGDLIEPRYNPDYLAELPHISSTLDELLDAMAQNIDGFGYEIRLRRGIEITGDTPEGVKEEINKERHRLITFFDHCSTEESFTELRKRTRYELELYGWAAWEIIRDTAGNIVGIERIPSRTIRATPYDQESLVLEQEIWEPTRNGEVAVRKVRVRKHFRRYAQVLGNGRKIWFKALGDPRTMDATTGEFYNDPHAVPPGRRATEVLWFSLPSTDNSPYGKPRYIAELYSIAGTRAAVIINYETLDHNMVPAMIMSVSGGAQLTKGTIARIKEWVQRVRSGRNMSSILLVEAQTKPGAGGQTPNAKIEITKLRDLQREDAMFMDYLKNNDERIRACFRLPDIFTGGGGKYNRAVADRLRMTAEEQVFAPLRQAFDWKITTELLGAMGVKYHRFVSRGPNIVSTQTLIEVMPKAENSGGMTPRIARQIMSLITGQDYGEIDPEKLDPDVPYSMQLSQGGVRVTKGVDNILDGEAILEALFGSGVGTGVDHLIEGDGEGEE